MARFFIDRPVFAWVISIVIVLIGLMSLVSLPLTQYPEITPPTIQVTCQYAGANAQVVADTVALYGHLDILVNNAGISGSAVNDLLETGIWHRVMEVNSTGVFLGTAAAVRQMQKNGGGSIVNLSSISGVVGQTMVHMSYNASKGAVRTMTKATAVQFGKDNIRCNSIHPGLMPPMRTSGATADPTVRAKMLRAVPLGRSGEVDEVANAVLFLASDEASYITGAELYVDGGYLAM